jgi:Lon protease-like protein
MTQAGNVTYNGPEDLPATVPVFPLSGVLLLPRGHLPLNIFEPRYLDMVTEAMRGARLIGMLQPRIASKTVVSPEAGDLSEVGCVGRITQYAEAGDGRVVITLMGVSRFKVVAEIPTKMAFRTCRIDVEPFIEDFTVGVGNDEVDRKTLLDTFKAYLEARNLEADWGSIERASNESLVNTLSMMSPYGPAEKQALLEAKTLRERADMLVAVTELALASEAGDNGSTLQ